VFDIFISRRKEMKKFAFVFVSVVLLVVLFSCSTGGKPPVVQVPSELQGEYTFSGGTPYCTVYDTYMVLADGTTIAATDASTGLDDIWVWFGEYLLYNLTKVGQPLVFGTQLPDGTYEEPLVKIS
jgi:hypothetical protein